MARKDHHVRGNNRAGNELFSKVSELNIDRSDLHGGKGLKQNRNSTRCLADTFSITDSRFYGRAINIRSRNEPIAFNDTTQKKPKENSSNRSWDSPALRSCIAFEEENEYLKSPRARKAGKSVKILKKGAETSCPTCSGSGSDISTGQLSTKGKLKKNNTDMKLLIEALNNLENSDCVSNFTSKKSSTPDKNMTFTNDQLLQIDQHNRILLNKIVKSHQPRRKPVKPPLLIRASSAINRSKKQLDINYNNQILLRKIQQAKSTLPLKRSFTGKQY